MANNLKLLILPMRSSSKAPAELSRRGQALAERKAEAAKEAKRKRKFESIEQAAAEGGTLSQEKKVHGKDDFAFQADCILLKEMGMKSGACASGDDFEAEFLRQYSEGIELPNIFIDLDGSETRFDGTYKITRVKKVKRRYGKGDGFPPVVDFIGYNKDWWFPLEIKSQVRKVGQPQKHSVWFRNWRQVRELADPTQATLPEDDDDALAVVMGAERLPGLVIKRDRYVPPQKNSKSNVHMSVFGVYSVKGVAYE